MKTKTGHEISELLLPILYGLFAIAVALLVCWSGQYPFGSDAMTHIYRGSVFYEALSSGNLVPNYDPMWYNGLDILQNLAPLSYYVMALSQMFVGGDPLDAYLMYVGLIAFVGALSWLWIGKKTARIRLGGFLGIAWFVMPHNLYVLFFEGNLARALCMVILPLYIFFLYEYVENKQWKYLAGIIATYGLLLLSELEYSIMLAIGTLLFLIVFAVIHGKWRHLLYVIGGLASAVGITGIWSFNALIAIRGTDRSEVMGKYFQSIFITLNPLERQNSLNLYFYFGLAAFLLAVFGVIFSKKKSMTGFWTALLLLGMTTASMYPVAQIMPGRNHLLMCQYISIALCLILYGFLKWDCLRKPFQIVFCVLLILDASLSYDLVCGTLSGVPVADRFDEMEETTLIKQAKEVSGQRIALLDESVLESMGPYLVTAYGEGKASSFGSDWLTAATSDNIKQLNRAMTGGFYPYLFDRCKELGNDTVLVKVSQLNTYEAPIESLDEAAAKVGYELVGTNEFYRLYDMDIEGSWGTVTDYPAIGIGTHAEYLSLYLPGVEEVSSANLNDYTFEELSQYEFIYLAGFTYDDKKSAEDMILRLSEAGVRILIQADGIPEDRESHTRDFLGAFCNDIVFENGYPLLDTHIGVLDCDLFPQGYESWKTVYVNGLDETYGTVREEDLDLDFCGTVKNENITVLGLNLVYYYSLTRDEGVRELLSDIALLSGEELPKREIVPFTMTYEEDVLTITSEYDNVNTALANHEMFTAEAELEAEHNLLYVNAGETVIKMEYPHLYRGILATAVGVILALGMWFAIRRKD